jgi:hypothetical protein
VDGGLISSARGPEVGLRIELLWWEGCPSTDRALAELRAALAQLDLPDDVQLREIRTDDEAVAEAFTGSPTILIDGVELMTVLGRGAGDEPAGLNCRVYQRRDGRVSPTPDPEDLRDALVAVNESKE